MSKSVRARFLGMWLCLAYPTFMLMFVASTRTIVGMVLLYADVAGLIFASCVTVFLFFKLNGRR